MTRKINTIQVLDFKPKTITDATKAVSIVLKKMTLQFRAEGLHQATLIKSGGAVFTDRGIFLGWSLGWSISHGNNNNKIIDHEITYFNARDHINNNKQSSNINLSKKIEEKRYIATGMAIIRQRGTSLSNNNKYKSTHQLKIWRRKSPITKSKHVRLHARAVKTRKTKTALLQHSKQLYTELIAR